MTAITLHNEASPPVTTAPSAASKVATADKLSGAQRALVFVLSLEEQVATRVLGLLDESEVRRLHEATAGLAHVSPETVRSVHKTFARVAKEGRPASLRGSEAYLRKLAGKALGAERMAIALGKQDPKVEPAEALARLEPAQLAALVEEEPAQTIAVVLSMLETDRAAAVIEKLAADQRWQVITRLARLETIPDDVIGELEAQLAVDIQRLGERAQRSIKGADVAAAVVRKLKKETADMVVGEVVANDPKVGEKLKRSLFSFEDLSGLDSRGFQTLVKEVASDQLVLAMKTASEALKQKIFGALSSRAADMLREELAMMGPTRIADVETAQAGIVERALALESDGAIRIARAGGDDYV